MTQPAVLADHVGSGEPGRLVTQGMVTQGMVTQGMVTQGMVTQGMVTQGMVTQGMVTQGMVTQGMVTQGMVTQGMVTQGRVELVGGDSATHVPVASALARLLPGGALQRGSVVTVSGSGSLVLALIAEASSAGAWCAEVGTAGLGIAAAAEAGVVLDRFVRVPRPGDRWPEVVAALLDGFDLVVVHPWVDDGTAAGPARRGSQTTRAQHAIRRLTARVRERGAVVVATSPWEGATLNFTVTAQRWHGLGAGHGHLTAREVEVTAVGRGAAVRPRRVRLWLPGPDGRVAAYEEPAEVSDPEIVWAPPRSDNALGLAG